jgi:hypothetical protein
MTITEITAASKEFAPFILLEGHGHEHTDKSFGAFDTSASLYELWNVPGGLVLITAAARRPVAACANADAMLAELRRRHPQAKINLIGARWQSA